MTMTAQYDVQESSHASTAGKDPVLAYCIALRETLQDLVQTLTRDRQKRESTLTLPAGTGMCLVRAQELLAMDTGRHAQQEIWIMDELVCHGYILADYLYPQFYGMPRSPSGYIPTQEETIAALDAIKVLTHQSWALSALLDPPVTITRPGETP